METGKTKVVKENIQLGDVIRLETVKPVHGGAVLAWCGGHTIFVEDALPKEDVSVEITQVRSKFLRATVTEVHTAHPGRIDPTCAATAQGAGCCDYAHATAELQEAMKLSVVQDQLSRMADIDTAQWPTTVQRLGESVEGWRIRQRYTANAQGRLGTYQKRSQNLILREDYPCCQEDPRFHELSWKEPFSPGSEVVFAVGDDGEPQAVLLEFPTTAHTQGNARARAVARRQRRERSPRRTLLTGSGIAQQRVQDTVWHIPIDCFWQAHRNAAATYAELVSREADLAPGEAAWDLYGGAGVFAKALYKAQPDCAEIWSVDVDKRSIAAGHDACADAPQINLVKSPVARWLPQNEKALPNPGTVVVDPPRSGVGRSIIERISARSPHTILHFGCDPASFARDLADWKRCGYGVQKIEVFDAFPNTHHMECFAKLEPLI